MGILWHAKWVWGVLNGFALVSLSLAIFLHVYMRFPSPKHKKDLVIMILLFLAPFILYAYPGETVFWISGSVNYLWMCGITLWFLLPYRFYLSRQDLNIERYQKYRVKGNKAKVKNYSACVGIAILAFLSGSGNENVSPAIIVILGFILAWYFFYCKKNKYKQTLFLYIGFIAFVVGTVVMLTAPGLTARAERENFETLNFLKLFEITQWIKLFGKVSVQVLLQEFLFVFPVIVLLICVKFWKHIQIVKSMKLAFIYFILGLASIATFLPTSFYPARTFFVPSVFFLIAILFCYESIFSYIQNNGVKTSSQICVCFVKCIFSIYIVWALFIMYAGVLPAFWYVHSRAQLNAKAMYIAHVENKQEALIDTASGWGDVSKDEASFALQYNIYLLARKSADDDKNKARAAFYDIPAVRGQVLSEVPSYVLRSAKIIGGVRRLGKKLYKRLGGIE